MPIRGDTAPSLPTYSGISPLGTQGGQSLVFLSHHEGFDKSCVQKVVRPAGLTGKLAFYEPQMLDALKHPKIVPVLDCQYDPDNPGAVVFTMPYYPSGSVRFALEQGYHFSLHQAISIACDQLVALGFIHSKGFVDRDVKAANLLLSDDMSEAFLSDIGLVARLEGDGMAPGNVGTPIYQPPESFGPMGRIRQAGDIFGVGWTLLELLNGPIDYSSIDPNRVISRLGHGWRGLPDSAIVFEPHVPSELRSITRRALLADPAQRYQRARTMAIALRRVRCIDWRVMTRGGASEGEWEGTWPPSVTKARRRVYKVTAQSLKSGKVRVEAFQKTTAAAGWRRFGVSSRDISPRDSKALAQVFSAVNAKVAHAEATS